MRNYNSSYGDSDRLSKAWQRNSMIVEVICYLQWPGCSVLDVENTKGNIPNSLDHSGIDRLVITGNSLIGLSVRMQSYHYYQYCMSQFECPTFTIRIKRSYGNRWSRDSELGKTIDAVRNSTITASYQLHCYMDSNGDQAISFGLADRISLFQYVVDNPHLCGSKSTGDYQTGQEQSFVYIPFKYIPDNILIRSMY